MYSSRVEYFCFTKKVNSIPPSTIGLVQQSSAINWSTIKMKIALDISRISRCLHKFSSSTTNPNHTWKHLYHLLSATRIQLISNVTNDTHQRLHLSLFMVYIQGRRNLMKRREGGKRQMVQSII
jgi:hypothetical protein